MQLLNIFDFSISLYEFLKLFFLTILFLIFYQKLNMYFQLQKQEIEYLKKSVDNIKFEIDMIKRRIETLSKFQ